MEPVIAPFGWAVVGDRVMRDQKPMKLKHLFVRTCAWTCVDTFLDVSEHEAAAYWDTFLIGMCVGMRGGVCVDWCEMSVQTCVQTLFF